MVGSRLLSGAGYTLKVPAIDLAEVGAGGGSMLWIDAGGALQVGPQSAGASPGPVCYEPGGTEPTDHRRECGARLHQPAPSGRRRAEAARRTRRARRWTSKIARPLGMSVEQAAYGAHLIAASNMIRAIKAVSSERGRDPREYALVGVRRQRADVRLRDGAEPGIGRVLIPPRPACSRPSGCCTRMSSITSPRRASAARRRSSLARSRRNSIELEADARARLAAGRVRGRRRSRSPAAPCCTTRASRSSWRCRCRRGGWTAALALEEAYGVGARAHLWASGRQRRTGRAGHAESGGPRPSRRCRGRRWRRSAGLPEGVDIAEPVRRAYFGPAPWLARDARREPGRSAEPHAGSVHRRGIRFDVRHPAGLHG